MSRAFRPLFLAALLLLPALDSSAQAFTSMCGGFSVAFPIEPKMSTDVIDVPGGKATVVGLSVRSGAEYFIATYTNYPVEMMASSSPDIVLGSLTADSVQRLAGELIEEDLVEAAGYPGIAYAVSYGVPRYVSRSKSILAGNRLFTISVVHPATDESRARSVAFLDSFSIDPASSKLFAAGLPGGSGGWREADVMCLSGCSRGAATATRCDHFCACYRDKTGTGMSELQYSRFLAKTRGGKSSSEEDQRVEEARKACLSAANSAP